MRVAKVAAGSRNADGSDAKLSKGLRRSRSRTEGDIDVAQTLSPKVPFTLLSLFEKIL
jgi:hypothetical protein